MKCGASQDGENVSGVVPGVKEIPTTTHQWPASANHMYGWWEVCQSQGGVDWGLDEGAVVRWLVCDGR